MLLKKYSDFGGGKTKSDSEFLSYNHNVKFWKKISRQKKINILTLVLSEQNFSTKRKTIIPPPPSPLQVKWSVPKWFGLVIGMCRRFQQLFSSIVNNRFTGGETM